MRQFLTFLVVAAITTGLPGSASANNQGTANRIAKDLRASGQLNGYSIEVKYQEGTAWLQGTVRDQQQVNTALKMAFQTPGVTRVVNRLKTGTPPMARRAQIHPAAATRANVAIAPERRTNVPMAVTGRATPHRALARPATGRSSRRSGKSAQRLASSFTQTPVQKVAATQPQAASPQVRAPAAGRPIPAAFIENVAATQPQTALPQVRSAAAGRPIPAAYIRPDGGVSGNPIPAYVQGAGGGVAPARYDQPHLPNYAWPSYAAYPNYAALTYPKQYSPAAWPFIGPFYPYPQVPLGWRKVTLEWDDGWWMLDFKD